MCAQIDQRRKIIADKQAYTRSVYAHTDGDTAKQEKQEGNHQGKGQYASAHLLSTNRVWEKSIKMMYKITCRKRSVHY